LAHSYHSVNLIEHIIRDECVSYLELRCLIKDDQFGFHSGIILNQSISIPGPCFQ